MSDIRFDTEQEYLPKPILNEQKGLTALAMKWGLAKSEKSAQYVLLGAAVGMIVLAFVAYGLLSPGGRGGGLRTPAVERTIPGPGGQPTGEIAP